tara:strand:+ start:1175 stop:2362 length:1188 start_codon:yes stop_codon:yes gene_type:complete
MTSFHLLDLQQQRDTVLGLRIKYQPQGFIDASVVNEARNFGISPEYLCDLIGGRQGVVPIQSGKPVTTVILEPLTGNEDSPRYHLSKVPLGEYPKKLSSDNYVKHPAKVRWGSMQSRCIRPSDPAYHNYGGRGILICDAWHRLNPNGRANYCRWLDVQLTNLGLTYDNAFDVDREDNEDHYSPANCRIIPRNINSQNTRFAKLDFDTVVSLRREVANVKKEERTKYLTKRSDELGINDFTLERAVKGETWANVNDAADPVVLGGGKPGAERQITDEMVVEWRNRLAELAREERQGDLQKIAEEAGFHIENVRAYVTGKKGEHLNETVPPVFTRRNVTDNQLRDLAKRYEKVWRKESLNAFCSKHSETLGIPRGTLYARLQTLLPEYLWRKKRTSS